MLIEIDHHTSTPDYRHRVGDEYAQDRPPMGWSEQELMIWSEEEHRGQGIYSSMLDEMLAATSHYDEIESHHHIMNNDIIALKLRRGFHIVGLDQNILIGPRVTLRYFHNEALLSLMHQRTGLPA